MKLLSLSLCALVALTSAPAYAWPGMGKINEALIKRNGGNDDGSDARELIGDLRTTSPAQWTKVGKLVAGIILGFIDGESDEGGNYHPPGSLDSKACKTDVCCVWGYVSDQLTKLFTESDGQCNDLARAAVRMGFHDAATWSKSKAADGQDFGGADGSLVLANEIKRPENKGLERVVAKAWELAKHYRVGVADLVQFMAIHATVTCPLGPRLRVFVGRRDSSHPSLDGLLPGVTQPADDLIALFEDKTIQPHDLAALLGAHTTSKQFFFNTSHSGESQDDTPGVWDVRFYGQTLENKPMDGVFRFESDIVLANHPRVHDEWVAFAGPNGQDHWNGDYATAYTRLSLLGVNNINSLKECTKVLPPAKDGRRQQGGKEDKK